MQDKKLFCIILPLYGNAIQYNDAYLRLKLYNISMKLEFRKPYRWYHGVGDKSSHKDGTTEIWNMGVINAPQIIIR